MDESNSADEDRARNRWLAIGATRIGGAIMAVAGLIVLGGRVGGSPVLGYALFGIGLVGVLFLPTYLARRWRSPPE